MNGWLLADMSKCGLEADEKPVRATFREVSLVKAMDDAAAAQRNFYDPFGDSLPSNVQLSAAQTSTALARAAKKIVETYITTGELDAIERMDSSLTLAKRHRSPSGTTDRSSEERTHSQVLHSHFMKLAEHHTEMHKRFSRLAGHHSDLADAHRARLRKAVKEDEQAWHEAAAAAHENLAEEMETVADAHHAFSTHAKEMARHHARPGSGGGEED